MLARILLAYISVKATTVLLFVIEIGAHARVVRIILFIHAACVPVIILRFVLLGYPVNTADGLLLLLEVLPTLPAGALRVLHLRLLALRPWLSLNAAGPHDVNVIISASIVAVIEGVSVECTLSLGTVFAISAIVFVAAILLVVSVSVSHTCLWRLVEVYVL